MRIIDSPVYLITSVTFVLREWYLREAATNLKARPEMKFMEMKILLLGFYYWCF